MMNSITRSLVILLMAVVLFNSCACGTKTDHDNIDFVSIASVAENISVGVGTMSHAANGEAKMKVLVFEESHTSKAIQIEIAIMINRLHEQGTRVLALEAAVATDTPINVEWFHRLPRLSQNDDTLEKIAVRLLKEGEINNAEFMSLVYDDIEIWGIEDASEYAISLSNEASSSLVMYLMAIAERSMTNNEVTYANQLADQEKYEEFLEYVIGCDDWTKSKYDEWMNSDTTAIEESLKLINEVDAKARQTGATLDNDTLQDFVELKTFFKTASDRSVTMTDNTLDLCSRSIDAPVAMIIGAGHTSKVTKLLGEDGAAYAIVTPNSLNAQKDNSTLSYGSYERKLARLSVDRSGMLGSFLDCRPSDLSNERKPAPVLDQTWLRGKTELYYVTELIACGAAGGGVPPFGLKDVIPLLKYVKVDIASISIDIDEVIFKAQVPDNQGQLKEIWIRTAKPSPGEAKSLEQLLIEALEDVKTEASNTNALVELPSGTLLQVFDSRAAAMSTRIRV